MRFIGKPEWFTYRWDGWGIMARTWQGWVHIGAFCGAGIALALLPLPEPLKFILLGLVAGVFLVDVAIIMTQLGKVHDERERLHQLIIERNCSFAAVAALVVAMGYQIYQNRHRPGPELPFDPWLLVVILVMALTKLLSTLYLRWKR